MPADDLDGALAEAYARGDQRAAEILAGPEMLTCEAFAACLGISPEAVRREERSGRVLGLTAGSAHRYPRWQVTAEGRPLPGLQDLFERLGGFPWAVYRFLLQHHPELHGATALEALQRGERERVIAAAENAAGGFS